MIKQVYIETERFLIRNLELKDALDMFALDSDPAVHEFLGKNPISALEESKEIIRQIRKQYDANGLGRLAIIDKETNEFIGWTGIKYEENVREYSYYDLGYRLRKKFWGKGIATETAVASLKYGFETLSLKEICAAADVNNMGSNKVLRKVGMQYVEQFDFEGELHNWYRITKPQWQSLK
ncbi:GNAT family N-acetyltransferase [Jejudonia soesokkakensis]|uniref:GNAT family N-acetyltransferase n=1 Tax=Jejudonia soesokkakensis TaxID=1323432 RepID=A0ABW2MV27_9FLAO